jgi:hypothetical protein
MPESENTLAYHAEALITMKEIFIERVPGLYIQWWPCRVTLRQSWGRFCLVASISRPSVANVKKLFTAVRYDFLSVIYELSY